MKNILMIGGTGTLGQAMLELLLTQDINAVRIYARHEHTMHLLKQKYGEHPKIRYIIGDIGDKERLSRAMENIDTCFNFAALKHVWSCQSQPLEAIKTNIIGVQNAIDCAIGCNIKTFVQMSTDKVVNAINTYGKTKALAEDLVLNAHLYQGDNRTRFIVIRSGNIINSSGSVLEVWREQQKQGQPLTVTDLNAERFMANKKNIAQAIVKAITEGYSGLVVLKMPCYKVSDLLKEFEGCKVNITGLARGEKLKESLWRDGEEFTVIEVS